MSIETWKAEFYPTSADGAVSSDLEAAEHSLRKWRGATIENLERHGLRSSEDILYDEKEEFYFDADTCALCCRVCRTLANGFACVDSSNRSSASPCRAFAKNGNPAQMIQWLERAVEYAKKEKAK